MSLNPTQRYTIVFPLFPICTPPLLCQRVVFVNTIKYGLLHVVEQPMVLIADQNFGTPAPTENGLFRANFKAVRFLRLRLQRAIVIAGSRTAVNQKGGAGYKRALVAHQQFRHICRLVRRTGPASGTLGKHILIEIPAGAVKLIQSQRPDGALTLRIR